MAPFNNRRQIASYTGLCPGQYSSGNTRLQSCVTKHANPRLRAALVELAWRLIRFQPNYKPIVKWRQILAKGALATGAARKKAIVAVARQLAVDLWRIKTGRLRAEELGLPDRIDQMLLRQRAQVRIGVRAAGNKPTSK